MSGRGPCSTGFTGFTGFEDISWNVFGGLVWHEADVPLIVYMRVSTLKLKKAGGQVIF